ncbi:MAG: hypothetical protein QNK92_14070 [Amylibacter sp.]
MAFRISAGAASLRKLLIAPSKGLLLAIVFSRIFWWRILAEYGVEIGAAQRGARAGKVWAQTAFFEGCKVYAKRMQSVWHLPR